MSNPHSFKYWCGGCQQDADSFDNLRLGIDGKTWVHDDWGDVDDPYHDIPAKPTLCGPVEQANESTHAGKAGTTGGNHGDAA